MEKMSISAVIKEICDEKGIAYESVLETIESALAAAYRKDFGNKMQNIKIEFNPDTGAIKAFDVKEVVEDVPEEELTELEGQEGGEELKADANKPTKVSITKPSETTHETKRKGDEGERGEKGEKGDDESKKKVNMEDTEGTEGTEDEEEKPRFNPRTMIQISEAKEIDKKLKVGDEMVTKLEVPGAFGRMAAQTAKQVIIQKLREAERETLYNEYKEKEGEVLVGTVQRREGRVVLVDLGRVTAIMTPEGQISSEDYSPGQHLKVYVVSVEQTTKGPEIIVSRAHQGIVKKLFETEIPEIANGVVEIKGIAREAGSRTKISVFTEDENIDPIGSCIGQRGARVQTIIAELKGEKIDIIEYSEDPTKYIAHAMSPAKITDIKIDEENKTATVTVAEDQLSLAIGKAGQNVRLAAQLTGWKIDIVPEGEKEENTKTQKTQKHESTDGKEEAKEDKKVAEVAKVTKVAKNKDKKKTKEKKGATKKVEEREDKKADKKADKVKKEAAKKSEAESEKQGAEKKKKDENKKDK